MPRFILRFVNRSQSSQDWLLGRNGQLMASFELLPDFASELADHDYTQDFRLEISISTDDTLAAASLVYTAATSQWTLETLTPAEWALAVGNGYVTVRGLLEGDPGLRRSRIAFHITRATAPSPAH